MSDKPARDLTAVSPVKQPGTLVAITGMETLLCNVPVKSHEQRMVVFNAIAGQCGKLDDYINKTVFVKNAIIARHDWTDKETGEVTPGYKVWLILKDDEIVFSGSNGLTKSILLIQGFFGDPPWEPCVKCEVKQIQIKDGQRWIHLNLAK